MMNDQSYTRDVVEGNIKLTENEEILDRENNVSVTATGKSLGVGTLWVTSSCLAFAAEGASEATCWSWPNIIMHCVSDAAENVPHVHLYCMLDTDEEEPAADEDEDEDADVSMPDLRIALAVEDEARVGVLYQAFNRAAELNPDEEVEEDAGNFFDAASLVTADDGADEDNEDNEDDEQPSKYQKYE